MRETRSTLPPGGNDTTQRIGLLGQSCAPAAVAANRTAKRVFFTLMLVCLPPGIANTPQLRGYCPKPHGRIVRRSQVGPPRGRGVHQRGVHCTLVRAGEVRAGERPGATCGCRAGGVFPFPHGGKLQGAAYRRCGSARRDGRGPASVCKEEKHLMGSDLHLAPVEAATLISADAAATTDLIQMRHGGGGAATRFVCGYLACSRSLCRPLLDTLPRLLRIPIGDGPEAALLRHLLRVGVRESSATRPGTES